MLAPALLLSLAAAAPPSAVDVVQGLFPGAKRVHFERYWGVSGKPVDVLGPVHRKDRIGYVRVDEIRTVDIGQRLIVFPIYLVKKEKPATLEQMVTTQLYADRNQGLTLIQAVLVDRRSGKFLGKAPTFPLESGGAWRAKRTRRSATLTGLRTQDFSGVTGARMTYGIGGARRHRYFARTESGALDVSVAMTPIPSPEPPPDCRRASAHLKRAEHEPRAYFRLVYDTVCPCDEVGCALAGVGRGNQTKEVLLKSVQAPPPTPPPGAE